MKKLFFVLILTSISAFAQDNVSTPAPSVAKSIKTSELCKEFALEINRMDETEKKEKALVCQKYYTDQLKEAIKLINKKEKTACDYLDLKDQVSYFNQLLESYLGANTPDSQMLEDMRDYYQYMYSSDAMGQCDNLVLSDMLFNQFLLENSQIPEADKIGTSV